MGTKYEFKCSNCNYSAEVSGGNDEGMYAFVTTMTCTDCNELVDVLVGTLQGARKKMQKFVNTMKDDFGKCPQCSKKNVVKWDVAKMSCPKCGARMAKGEETCLWAPLKTRFLACHPREVLSGIQSANTHVDNARLDSR